MNDAMQSDPEKQLRRDLLTVLAKSSLKEIERHWSQLNISPQYEFLKKPEFGMTMVRARAGGDGEVFNMGEMTVTRCVLKLKSNEIGYGYTAGREKEKSILIAIIDACFQNTLLKTSVTEKLFYPLQEVLNVKEAQQSEKTDTSKVNFFTMVRGE